MKKWLLPILLTSMFFYFGCADETTETNVNEDSDVMNGDGSGMVGEGEVDVDAVDGEGAQVAIGDSTVYNCSNPSNASGDILITLKESDSEDGHWNCGSGNCDNPGGTPCTCHCSLIAEGKKDNPDDSNSPFVYSESFPLLLSQTYGSKHCSTGLEQVLNNIDILFGNNPALKEKQLKNPVHNAEGAESMWTCEAQQVVEEVEDEGEAEESEEEVEQQVDEVACGGGKNEEEKERLA